MDEQRLREIIREEVKPLQMEMQRMLPDMTMMQERMGAFEQRMDSMKAHMDTRFDSMDRRHDQMMNTLDSIAGMLSDRKIEEASTTRLLGEHGQKIDNHEQRIARLEHASA